MKKLFFIALLLLPFRALAFTNDGVEIEPLFFGQIIINDNSAIRSCTIPAGGTESCDAEITILQPGQFGVLRLSGFDPTVPIFASVDDTSTTLTAGGQTLDIKNFIFDPDIHDFGTALTPDASGTLIVKVGATLQTRAGVTYDIAPHRGTFSLQINY